ncbi:hypothetical protein Tco_0733221 [Tanacetum coccineum]
MRISVKYSVTHCVCGFEDALPSLRYTWENDLVREEVPGEDIGREEFPKNDFEVGSEGGGNVGGVCEDKMFCVCAWEDKITIPHQLGVVCEQPPAFPAPATAATSLLANCCLYRSHTEGQLYRTFDLLETPRIMKRSLDGKTVLRSLLHFQLKCGAVLWDQTLISQASKQLYGLHLTNSPEVDADILAYRGTLARQTRGWKVGEHDIIEKWTESRSVVIHDDDVALIVIDDDDVVVCVLMACVFPGFTRLGMTVRRSTPERAQPDRNGPPVRKFQPAFRGSGIASLRGRLDKWPYDLDDRLTLYYRRDLEERNHLPPRKVWGDRTVDEWRIIGLTGGPIRSRGGENSLQNDATVLSEENVYKPIREVEIIRAGQIGYERAAKIRLEPSGEIPGIRQSRYLDEVVMRRSGLSISNCYMSEELDSDIEAIIRIKRACC